MNGDLAQTMGRGSVVVTFRGIFYGESAAEELGHLRQAFLALQPVDFFTAAVGEGYFTQVLISRLDVAQRAGFLDEFDYLCEVVEYVEPPEPAVADPFGDLDAGLLDEAASLMDQAQNALEEATELIESIANIPSFGDPTAMLADLPNAFEGLLGEGATAISALAALF
jgi:hypothetical protein